MDWQDFRVHQRLSLDSSIITIKESWHLTGKLLPQTIERLTRSVIITSTGASNGIEGNRLSDIEVENLYKNLRIKKFKKRDEQEIAGTVLVKAGL